MKHLTFIAILLFISRAKVRIRVTSLVVLLWVSFCFGEGRGLEVLRFNSPQKSIVGDSVVTVVRIDPKFYSFRLLSASEHGKGAGQHKSGVQNLP